MTQSDSYDALLFVSFGGPEGPDDVIPFLENVLRGKNVPRERMLEVAKHYNQFGGISPINEQNRKLIEALETLFSKEGPPLKIYWGNRNWHPLLPDTIAQMQADGIKKALAFVTSAFGSYSGCRQYRENIEAACNIQTEGAPYIEKLRLFFNHPGFISANAARLEDAFAKLSPEARTGCKLVFTAHSIPTAMANNCLYVSQLQETGRLIAQSQNHNDWQLVYQSRSGPASQPWLEPDIGDYLKELAQAGYKDVVVQPIGFISDHLEVIYDIDIQAQELAKELGINLLRASTAGTHPDFVKMIQSLILERTANRTPSYLGDLGVCVDQCNPECCKPAVAAGRPPAAEMRS